MLVCGILAAGVLLRVGHRRLAGAVGLHCPPPASFLPTRPGCPGLIQAFYQDLNTGRYRKVFERAFEASRFLDLRLDTNGNIEDNGQWPSPAQNLVARAKSELGEKGERLSTWI